MKLKNLFIATLLMFATSCENNSSSSQEFEESSKWNVTYYYNYEGNTTIYKTVSATDDTLISKPIDPSREGYLFNTWYKDSYCKIPFDFQSDKITANTSLYASWTAKESYSITWQDVSGVSYISTDNKDLPESGYTNDKVSFKLNLADQGYVGEAIVLVNNQTITSNNGIYSFTLTSNTVVTVTGFEPEISYYTITFTLPSGWSPSATNPRLYYWGSETLNDSMFTNGAASNMKLLSGRTFYIDIVSSITLEGLIIIFDQGNEVKQSFDITNNLPTTPGTYEIVVPDWSETGWEVNSSGVWSFKAVLEKR